MRALIATAIVLLSGTAFGADCPYVNEAGSKVTFVAGGENLVRIAKGGMAALACTWGVNGDTGAQDIQCDDGTKGDYFFAPTKLHGTQRDLLIFDGQVWYRSCP